MGAPQRSAQHAGPARQWPAPRTRTNQCARESTAALNEQVGNRWLDLFADVAPCPVHGGGGAGTFRLFGDAAGTGGGVCSACGPFANGIALLEWLYGWSYQEASDAVRLWLADDLFAALCFTGEGKLQVCLNPGQDAATRGFKTNLGTVVRRRGAP